jgi:hypothetical protein
MHEITAANLEAYLRAAGRLTPSETAEVRELPGGVSNVVLLVTTASGEGFVVKQARGQLRVKDEWLCPIERIWREVETLRICGELLGRGGGNGPPRASGIVAAFAPGIPELLWEDRANYCYAMSAAPPGHRTWKELLLSGDWMSGLGLATACGEMLAALHGRSWRNSEIANRLEDRSFFDQLRIDPYYRQIAKRHPDLAPQIQALIDSVWSHRLALVHGDFSPKNLLVWHGRVMLIDFEVGHFGDPAFDLGFFLTHLVLKSVWAGRRGPQYRTLATAFWNTYRRVLAATVPAAEIGELEQRMLLNLAGCLLARVDGKSPVDYLDPHQQERVRGLALAWLREPPASLDTISLAGASG